MISRARLRWASLIGALCVIFLSFSSCTIVQPDAWPAGGKQIILSFDDGPNPAIADSLLNVLAKHRVQATFFYVGETVKEHPQFVKRAYLEGHQLGIHSYSSRFPPFWSYKSLIEDIETSTAAIRAAIARPEQRIHLYRPPSGLVTPAVSKLLRESEIQLAYINFYARDSAWESSKKEKLLRKMKQGITKRNGGSIVFHESRFRPSSNDARSIDKTWLPDTLDEFIRWAKQEGYTFSSFSSSSQQ